MVAAAIVGAAVVGGVASNMAASKSSSAIESASQNSVQEQQREFDVLQQAQRPYQQTGVAALNQLARLYGLSAPGADPTMGTGAFGSSAPITGANSARAQNPADFRNGYVPRTPVTIDSATGAVTPTQGAPDYSSFFESPDYQFALKQGLNAVQNSAAAAGGLYSGNALRGITDYGQGLASQQYNNYANRLAAIAGIGQTAANQIGVGAVTTGANVGNTLMAAGNARASGIQQGYAGINNAIQGGMSNYLFYRQMQQNPYAYAGSYGGGNTMDAGDGYTFSY